MGLTECPKCGVEQPASEFRRKSSCKSCERASSLAKSRSIAARVKSGEGSEICARCRRSLPIGEFVSGGTSYVCRTCHSYARYGITRDDFLAIGDFQGWRCRGCKAELTSNRVGSAGSAHIDHCHGTGAVRGLLCLSCNHALGKVRDDPEILRALIEYLENPYGSEK